MTEIKRAAIDAIDELHATIPYDEYLIIRDGLDEIEPLGDRDEALEELWEEFGDIPMNPETEKIEAPFIGFPAGTDKEDVWHWFDERHSRGVHYLLYRDADGPCRYTWKEVLKREAMCFDCESRDCFFNDDGTCCFSLVNGRKPEITEEDGCTEGVIGVR